MIGAPVLYMIVFMAGLTLVLRGGARRVGREPRCVSCRYNLEGASAGADERLVCPECGSDCTGPGRVKIGTMQRRRAPLGIGLALMLLGATPLLQHLTGFDATTAKPLWLLQREGSAADTRLAERAQSEIIRRIGEQRLSDEQMASLVERTLEAQAQLDRPIGRWGDVFASLQNAGATTAEQHEQFVAGLLALEVTARRTIAVEDPIPFQVSAHWRGPRDIAMPGLPQESGAKDGLKIAMEWVRVGSVDLDPPQGPHRVLGWGTELRFLSDLPGDLPDASAPTAPDLPGEHELVVQCSVTWSADQAAAFGAGGPPVFTRQLSAPVRIVPDRPALRAVSADADDLQLGVDVLVPMPGRNGEPMVAVRRMPKLVPPRVREYAFEAVLIAGDLEHPLGAYASSSIDFVGGVWEVPSELLAALTPEQRSGAIIRLIPSEDIARRTVAVTTITAGPVELPVRLPPPHEQPAH